MRAAPPHWLWIAACQGKVGHDTAALARAAIKNALRRDRRHHVKGARLSAYKCRHCRAWHIGNTWRIEPS